MKIKAILEEALNAANREYGGNLSDRQLHQQRSTNFVEELASLLRQQYKTNSSVRVFSKHYKDRIQRLEFGLNELLYDVLVCETDTVSSSSGRGTLRFVSKAIWQIESEFARNSWQAVYDFNKLVLGSSENKLFIGPQGGNEQEFLKRLIPLASRCSSNAFVALVPHPSAWKINEQLSIHCWRLDREWQPYL